MNKFLLYGAETLAGLSVDHTGLKAFQLRRERLLMNNTIVEDEHRFWLTLTSLTPN